jgi:uncharacterized protein YdeI (YjbR/CyaY-like superfamily)
MPSKDPRVDEYIARAAPFAQPILKRLRATVHEACPAAVEEIKWGHPSFGYGGRMMAGMSAFKAHCGFGFWMGAKVLGAEKQDSAMWDYGRITALADLPPRRTTIAHVKRAMKLIDAGEGKMGRAPAKPKPPLRVPRDLSLALGGNAKAAATFAGFPPGQKREYVEWITEAKSEATRERRLEQAVAWMAEGKRRNWKYER